MVVGTLEGGEGGADPGPGVRGLPVGAAPACACRGRCGTDSDRSRREELPQENSRVPCRRLGPGRLLQRDYLLHERRTRDAGNVTDGRDQERVILGTGCSD